MNDSASIDRGKRKSWRVELPMQTDNMKEDSMSRLQNDWEPIHSHLLRKSAAVSQHLMMVLYVRLMIGIWLKCSLNISREIIISNYKHCSWCRPKHSKTNLRIRTFSIRRRPPSFHRSTQTIRIEAPLIQRVVIRNQRELTVTAHIKIKEMTRNQMLRYRIKKVDLQFYFKQRRLRISTRSSSTSSKITKSIQLIWNNNRKTWQMMKANSKYKIWFIGSNQIRLTNWWNIWSM